MDQEPTAKRLKPNLNPGDAAIYAEKIDALLSRNSEVPIKEAVDEAVRDINDREVTDLWAKVFAVCSRTLLNAEGESVQEMRSSRRWMDHVLSGSLNYLQQQFKAHMEEVVKNNMADGRRGGKETVVSLVEAYLNVKFKRSIPGWDGQHPRWALVFYAARVGDFKAAHDLLRGMIELPKPAVLLAVLESLDEARPFCVEMMSREKLATEWQVASLTCQDLYKKATYAALLGIDAPEVNYSIEDWLWAHLIACRTHPEGSERTFRRLQSKICVDLGEKYFQCNADGGYLLYFTALLLTGQLERAIYALEGTKYNVHAVHVAILSYQMKLLVLSGSIDDDTLAEDPLEKVNCRLNFSRVLIRYVESSLEKLGIKYAVEYYYFLHKIEVALPVERLPFHNDDDDEGDGMDGDGAAMRSLFQVQLSRLLQRHGGQVDEVLGRLNPKGEREGGIVDKFASVLNVSTLIGQVAEDVSASGDAFKACQLYVLADKPKEAAQLMSRQLSASANSSGGEMAKRCVEMAEWIIKLYKARSEVSTLITALRQLIKIHAFFGHSSRDQFETAVKLIEELSVIPLSQDSVRDSVSTFEKVPQDVRSVLPDLCLGSMRCVVSLCKRAGQRQDTEMWRRMRNYAESIILYCGMVPYRFPVSTISALMQLQSQIA